MISRTSRGLNWNLKNLQAKKVYIPYLFFLDGCKRTRTRSHCKTKLIDYGRGLVVMNKNLKTSLSCVQTKIIIMSYV